MFRRALKMACVACLLIVGTPHLGAAAERSPQIIPPPTFERPQPGDVKKSGGDKGHLSSGNASSKTGGNASSKLGSGVSKTPGGASNKSAGAGWGTTLGALTVVLALILLTAKVLRKSMPSAQKTLPIEVVQVLGRKPLDYRHAIHLIRCGSRLLVVGSSQEGLTTLCEITDPVEIDYLAGLCKASEPTSVANNFNQFFRKFQHPAAAESTVEDAIEPEIQSSSDLATLRLQERFQKSRHGESDASRGDPPHIEQTGESAA